VSTRIGIVGMPNAGKSSLFNALTKAGAEAANYPFTTIEPNVAVVPVRDERMEQVAGTLGSSEIVWDTVDFHDIAGLVAGAHKGEGLGNKFLANIRETHAIVHVVRAHNDENVIHPEGRVDPLADIETIETELVMADLDAAERRVDKVGKQARGGDRVAIAEEAWLHHVIEALQAGRPARGVAQREGACDHERDEIRDVQHERRAVGAFAPAVAVLVDEAVEVEQRHCHLPVTLVTADIGTRCARDVFAQKRNAQSHSGDQRRPGSPVGQRRVGALLVVTDQPLLAHGDDVVEKDCGGGGSVDQCTGDIALVGPQTLPGQRSELQVALLTAGQPLVVDTAHRLGHVGVTGVAQGVLGAEVVAHQPR